MGYLHLAILIEERTFTGNTAMGIGAACRINPVKN
jgi:hypothetical protein